MGTHFSCFQRCCDWVFYFVWVLSCVMIYGHGFAWYFLLCCSDFIVLRSHETPFFLLSRHRMSVSGLTCWTAKEKREREKALNSCQTLGEPLCLTASEDSPTNTFLCYPLNKFACEYFPLFSKILSHLNGKRMMQKQREEFFGSGGRWNCQMLFFLASFCPATGAVAFYIIHFCWNRIKHPCYSANYYFSFWRCFPGSHETRKKMWHFPGQIELGAIAMPSSEHTQSGRLVVWHNTVNWSVLGNVYGR